VVESQDGRRVLIGKVCVSLLALCGGAPNGIARIKVPNDKFLAVTSCNLKGQHRHTSYRYLETEKYLPVVRGHYNCQSVGEVRHEMISLTLGRKQPYLPYGGRVNAGLTPTIR
jgi:hypothetical protein